MTVTLVLAGGAPCSCQRSTAYLYSRASALLLVIYEVEDLQPQDDAEYQRRQRIPPRAVGKMAAGALQQSLLRGIAQQGCALALVSTGCEPSICTRKPLGQGARGKAYGS